MQVRCPGSCLKKKINKRKTNKLKKEKKEEKTKQTDSCSCAIKCIFFSPNYTLS